LPNRAGFSGKARDLANRVTFLLASGVPEIVTPTVPQNDGHFTKLLQPNDTLVTVVHTRPCFVVSAEIIKKIISCKIKIIAVTHFATIPCPAWFGTPFATVAPDCFL
jgi:hypothetical protein